MDGASAARVLLPGLPDAQPGGERSWMIEPGKNGHRSGSVARGAVRQVAPRKTGVRL